MKLSEYINSRLSVIKERIAAERIGGNDFKLHCELSAEAELRALECFLSSADYARELARQPITKQGSEPTEICPNAVTVPLAVDDRPGEKFAFCVCRTSGKLLPC